MTADERRSAALLFARELASGAVSLGDLERPEVRDAVASRGVPSRARRQLERVAYKRRWPGFRDDSVQRFAGARRAVLGEAAAGPARLLIRVDEFPCADALDDPDHGVEAFRRFHEIMAGAGVPYLLAVQPAVASRPLDPHATRGRALDDGERETLRALASDGVEFALHGYDHRTRFERPSARSELEGLAPPALEALLDRGLSTLGEIGIEPRVIVPPYNTFGADQYGALARRFAVVTGGPESIARLGYHRTPLWRGEAVYAPSYPPYYGRARSLRPALERLVRADNSVWVPVALHWSWESDDGWEALESLVSVIAPHARPWSEFLDEVDESRAAADARPLHVVSVQTSETQGGGEYATVNMLDALARRGAGVELLTNQPELAAGTAVRAVPIDLGPKLSRRTLWRVMLGFVPALARLRRALRRAGREAPIDALVLHYKKEQLMSLFVPRARSGALIWAEWGPIPAQFHRGLPRLAYRLAARRTAAIVAVSENTRESVLDVGVPAEKVAVVPNIIDPDVAAFDPAARERVRAEWDAGPDTFVVGVLSRLDAAKRNEVVIDALEHLPEDTWVVVAGSGDQEQALRERGARFGKRVRILPTPPGYGQQLLSACDVAVVAPHRTEGLPRAIVFGQLAERPVIVTDGRPVAGLVPEGTGAAIEPPHDPRALAACLDEYRTDPERRAREGQAGRRFALERYDIRAATEALERVFRVAEPMR